MKKKRCLTVQSSGGALSTASFLQGNVGLQLNGNSLCLIFTRTASSRYDYFLHFRLRGKKCLERLCHVPAVAPGPWEGRQGLKLRSLNGVTTDPHGLRGGSAPGHQRGKPWTLTCFPVSGSPSEPASQDIWGRQGEDIQQLGEPTLHLPVPSTCAWLCDSTQRAA